MSMQLTRIGAENPETALLPHASERSSGGRFYQRLLNEGRISECFQKTRNFCSYLYGPPYPPLSLHKVVEKYCEALFWTTFCGVYGGLSLCLITQAATDPAPDALLEQGSSSIAVMSCVGAISLLIGVRGLIILHKTCKAPRLRENQALLGP